MQVIDYKKLVEEQEKAKTKEVTAPKIKHEWGLTDEEMAIEAPTESNTIANPPKAKVSPQQSSIPVTNDELLRPDEKPWYDPESEENLQEKVISYRIKKWDSLNSISRKIWSSINDIISMNPTIKNKNIIHEGKTIQLQIIWTPAQIEKAISKLLK